MWPAESPSSAWEAEPFSSIHFAALWGISGLVSEGLPNKCSQHFQTFPLQNLKGNGQLFHMAEYSQKMVDLNSRKAKRSDCLHGAQLCCNTTCHTTCWMTKVSINEREIWMVEHKTMWWGLLSIQKSPLEHKVPVLKTAGGWHNVWGLYHNMLPLHYPSIKNCSWRQATELHIHLVLATALLMSCVLNLLERVWIFQ